MRENKLRELIKNNEPTLGIRLLSLWPGIAEIIGYTGIADYVELEGEYSPWDLRDLEDFCRATDLFKMSSMLKVDQNSRGFIAQRALGSGMQALLFADVRNAKDVEKCIKYVKAETPKYKGLNGCHMRRSSGYVVDCANESYCKAMDDIIIAIMIEKKEAVQNLEEILSIKGIDMVQFGPGDYSMSVGLEGQPNHPDIQKARVHVMKTAIKMGIRPRHEIDSIHDSMEDIKEFLDIGVIDFSLPPDVEIIYQWIREKGEELKGILNSYK